MAVCFVRTRLSHCAPCRLAEHIGTKTAVQIRSHAQKFFSKLEREQAAGNTSGISRAPSPFRVHLARSLAHAPTFVHH